MAGKSNSLVKTVTVEQREADGHQSLKTPPPFLQHCQIKGKSQNNAAFIYQSCLSISHLIILSKETGQIGVQKNIFLCLRQWQITILASTQQGPLLEYRESERYLIIPPYYLEELQCWEISIHSLHFFYLMQSMFPSI